MTENGMHIARRTVGAGLDHTQPQQTSNTDAMLRKLEDTRTLLAEAVTLREIKVVVDVAAAAELFAKRQGVSEELEMMARACKLDALRKLGFVLRETPRSLGGPPDGSGPIPSLDSQGITQSTAGTARRLSLLKESEFVLLRDSTRSLTAALYSVSIREARRTNLKSGRFLDFPLPGGALLRNSCKEEIRGAAERFNLQAEKLAREARWLALVAGELTDGCKLSGHVNEMRLRELWDKSAPGARRK